MKKKICHLVSSRLLIILMIFLFFTFPGKANAQTNAVSNDTIYTIAEKMPQFPGGSAELAKFLSKNLRVEKGSIGGKVIVQFTVTSSGEITEVQVLRPEDDEPLRKSAMELMPKMPRWIPGEHQGKRVAVRYTLPVAVCMRQ